jgi:ABC-type glycerol-3-phosphate transport system substrate-binding protein
MFLASVISRGGAILASPTSVGFGGAEGLESLKLYERCIKEAFCYVPKGFDWQDRFGEGKLLFASGTTTGRPFIKAAFKQPIAWSLFGVPSNGTAPSRTIQYGAVIAITRSTPEKQLAVWEFLKWFTDTKQTAKVATISAYMPVRASALEDSALKASWSGPDVQGKQAFDLVPTSAAGPSIRGYQLVRDAVFEMLTKVQTGTASAEDALAAAVRKANAALEENQ